MKTIQGKDLLFLWLFAQQSFNEYILQIGMIKVNSKFEQIIGASVVRLKALLDPQELQALQAQINALPKKMKQLNAEPYLFVFESMLRWKELIEPALLALGLMIEQNYITYSLYQRIVLTISPFVKDYSYGVIQLVQRVKEPHISFFELYFQIHANVAMPEDILRKFKALGYSWLSKAFQLAQREIPSFSMTLYSKFYPQEIGHLSRSEDQKELMFQYITLVMEEMKWMVDQNMGNVSPERGKNGWCFMCHKPANFYCKDTKVPVCGSECKKAHFQLATNTPGLHYNYSQDFQMNIQSLLVENISARRSPALSIDFLVAIYLYSTYIPKKKLQHSKLVAVPVIFQRIWILYLSYYGKRNEYCEHIFACCLDGQASFPRQMAAQYFMALAQDPRLFHVYYTYDRCSDFRLLSFVLHTITPQERAGLVQSLVKTAFEHYKPNNNVIIDNERSLIRTLNHVKDLSVQILSELFGQNYEEKVVLLVLRNQTEINRQKLGTLLITNQSLCRRFLEHIVKRKEGAPIDELLRQIFYFFNLKVSDKIYRLFELLAEVYIPQHPFNELNFFTYAYFVVMIVTEVNNPNLIQKPTESIILSRVEQFSPDLAKNHPNILREMLARVTGSPFRQSSRGVLSHYPPIPLEIWDEINPEEIIILNWEIIYQSALNKGLQVITIYRICTMVASQPAICQAFLQILVDQLSSPERDHFLLQSISSIIQLQPNAAGYLWKVILQQSRNVSIQGQSLHLGLIIHSTQQLTDDNFYQFCRQFCSQFNISEQPDLMLQLIISNINRIGLVTQLFLSNFQKGDNYYHKISVLKRLGKILKHHNEDQLAFLLLQMMKSVEVTPISQALILQAFLQINFDSLPHAQQFWTVTSQKCLQFKDEGRAALLQEMIKNAKKCESYESYLIQKTLNCHRMQLISEEILKNLNKLQPYLNDISRQVLSLFVLEDNLITIVSHFQYFVQINSVYDLIIKQIQKQFGLQKIGMKNIERILDVIKKTMINQSLEVLLKLDKLPCLVIQLLNVNWDKSYSVLNQYINKLVFNKNNLKEVVLVASTISILAQQFNLIVQSVFMKKICDNQVNKQERLNNLKEIIRLLYNISSIFQKDVQLRIQIKKYLKLLNVPSLLKTSILYQKIELKLCLEIGQSHLEVFQILLKQVQTVLKWQAQIQLQLKSKQKIDSLSRLYLGQANKDALKFGELLVEQALIYLKNNEVMDKKRKGLLRRLLLQLLVQGFFQESSCSFKSLSGTVLAQQINEIFSLLK